MPALLAASLRRLLLLTALGLALPATAATGTSVDAAAGDNTGSADTTDTDFAACVRQLQDTARQQGLSDQVVNDVLGQVSRNDRVIALDQRQPEFTETFAHYLSQRVTEAAWRLGRDLLKHYSDLFQRAQHDYGVPPQYLLAFWGLETNFRQFLWQHVHPRRPGDTGLRPAPQRLFHQ